MDHPPQLTIPVNARDHILGPPDAPITLLEYGDYECPYCGLAHPLVKDILQQMGRDIRFVFRHFPLVQVHPHAMAAAQAADAAGLQGKFWEMHDLLFENQHALGPEDMFGYAERLDLDLEAFGTAMENPQIVEQIRSDFRYGVRSGVNGTPSFYINGLKYDGPWDEGSLAKTLREMKVTAQQR